MPGTHNATARVRRILEAMQICETCSMKRPLFLFVLFIGTAVYWAVWLGMAGVVLWVHGDCAAGTTDVELAKCITEKTWIFRGIGVLAALLYVATIVGLVKGHWPKR